MKIKNEIVMLNRGDIISLRIKENPVVTVILMYPFSQY